MYGVNRRVVPVGVRGAEDKGSFKRVSLSTDVVSAGGEVERTNGVLLANSPLPDLVDSRNAIDGAKAKLNLRNETSTTFKFKYPNIEDNDSSLQ